MCQLSCHRLCWAMYDPYEAQPLMIAVQNASFVGRLRGDGPALAPSFRCCIRVVARRSSHDQWPHCPWPKAQRPYDSWFGVIVEVCLDNNGIEM